MKKVNYNPVVWKKCWERFLSSAHFIKNIVCTCSMELKIRFHWICWPHTKTHRQSHIYIWQSLFFRCFLGALCRRSKPTSYISPALNSLFTFIIILFFLFSFLFLYYLYVLNDRFFQTFFNSWRWDATHEHR